MHVTHSLKGILNNISIGINYKYKYMYTVCIKLKRNTEIKRALQQREYSGMKSQGVECGESQGGFRALLIRLVADGEKTVHVA